MAGVVKSEDANEAIVPEFETCYATVRTRDPDGFEFGCIEGAHQMQSQDADRAGVTKDSDLAATVSRDDLVELFTRTIE